MKTWKIAYTIEDGEHEYSDSFTLDLAAEQLDQAAAAAALADHWDRIYDFEPEERQRFLQELDAEGFAFLPGDTRAISGIGWEEVFPIVITVSDGAIEAVTGVPEGMRLEVRDWDNGGLDANGEPVPGVTVWE